MTTTSRTRRSLVVLTAAVATALALAGPAVAIDDIAVEQQPEEPPFPPPGDPDPTATIDGTPRCEPAAGVDYQIGVVDGPNRPYVATLEWENVDTGDGGAAGPAGGVDTGEGAIHLTGTVLYPPQPILVQGQLVGMLPQIVLDDELVVDVSCDDGGDDGDEPDPDPDPDVDPDVRSATPNFTG